MRALRPAVRIGLLSDLGVVSDIFPSPLPVGAGEL